MHGSIANHHLEYRVRTGETALQALIPSIDRTLQQSLAGVLSARLGALFGEGDEVVVVREVQTHVAVTATDCALSDGLTRRVGIAAADSLAAVIRAPESSDAVVRFPDQAAFVGTFIVELLAGRAWDYWFFGPFRPFRRASVRETIASVLAEHDRAAVLRWLDAGGHRDAYAFIEGEVPAAAEDIRTAGHDRSGAGALIDAALRIVAAAGRQPAPSRLRMLVSTYAAATELPPWTDLRATTMWVLDLVTLLLEEGAEEAWPVLPALANVDSVLCAQLDWLDVPLLRNELTKRFHPSGRIESSEVAVPPRPRTPSAAVNEILHALAAKARMAPLPTVFDAESLFAHLMAEARGMALFTEVDECELTVVLRRAARTWSARVHESTSVNDERKPSAKVPDAQPRASAPGTGSTTPTPEPQVVASPIMGSTLSEILIDAATPIDPGDGLWTGAAGVYLLTRPVLDLRLPALARACEVPLPHVLGLVASGLLNVQPPFDAGCAIWIGDADPALLPEADAGGLEQLRRSLERTLADQGALPPALHGLAIHPIAGYVMRAWARWLPGVHSASLEYLVRNCLARTGQVRVSPATVDVELDPAPLDVVLEMAGYFRPIDAVSWLEGRRMIFTRSR